LTESFLPRASRRDVPVRTSRRHTRTIFEPQTIEPQINADTRRWIEGEDQPQIMPQINVGETNPNKLMSRR
jgi:hypothetical protein